MRGTARSRGTAGSVHKLRAAKALAEPAGNLYGTTELGGASGMGVVFKLTGTGFH